MRVSSVSEVITGQAGDGRSARGLSVRRAGVDCQRTFGRIGRGHGCHQELSVPAARDA